MSASETVNLSDMDASREITFPVPWGIIAAKTWGDPCSSPVLLLHGIQDNAGTFDLLIPHLPRAYYYVCIDLPGHGYSSRMPKGTRLDFMNYVLSVNRVVRQLNWQQFILIGHSLGGQLSQYYAAMYPEQITKLVVLDAYGPVSVPVEEYLPYIRKIHERVIKMEEKILDSEPPSYTYEIALQRMIDNRRSLISREAAEKLVPRNVKQGKNGLYFSPDQRLKLSVSLPISQHQHMVNYSKIKSPFLLIITKTFYDFLGLNNPEMEKKTFISAFRKNPAFEISVVEGHHDVHSMEPQLIGPIISKFMIRQKSSL